MKLHTSNATRNSLLALLAIGSSALLHAQSLEITGVQSQTVGSGGATITGSGSPTNATTWAVGSAGVGVFQMNGGTHYMKVSATSFTGALSPSSPTLMVARTVNSQGLTDQGTLSVYVAPTSAAAWTLDLNFSFYSDSALLTPATITEFQLTSLDIDFSQRYYVQTADFTGGTSFTYSPLSGPFAGSTNITSAPAIAGFTGFTAVPSASFSDPRAAVSSRGTGTNFDIKLAHNAVALYMFEFRQNSSIIIPEPTSALLASAGMALFGLRRRRPQGA